MKSKLPKIITDRNAPECEICGATPPPKPMKGWGWSGRSRKFVRDLKSTKTVFALWCPRCNDSMHCLRINPTEGEVLELFRAAKEAAKNSRLKLVTLRKLTCEQGNAIWDALIEGGVVSDGWGEGRANFLQCVTVRHVPEYRFMGLLGFGGKFWQTNGKWYVTCYPEHETPHLAALIEKTNALLAALLESVHAAAENQRRCTWRMKARLNQLKNRL